MQLNTGGIVTKLFMKDNYCPLCGQIVICGKWVNTWRQGRPWGGAGRAAAPGPQNPRAPSQVISSTMHTCL